MTWNQLRENAMALTLQTDLARYIMDECGENVFLCYQCKKCTAGCPVAAYFDLTPNQVMRACQLGQTELVLNSRTIFLCAACETCSTRCPQGIDIARIMDVLEIRAQREGIKPKVRPVPMFYQAANRGIDLFGRMFELGLMAELYTRMFFAGELDLKQLFKHDLPMAVKMLRTGKLKFWPSIAHQPRDQHRPPASPREIAYYPGCSLHATGVEYNMSSQVVAEKLGLTLVEPEGWVCCGTSPAHSTDHFRSIVLPMKTLALVEEMGHKVVTMPCAACFSRFRFALYEVEHNPELKAQVAEAIGYTPSPGIQVDSWLDTITERVGYEAVTKAVVKPLSGLKVACYYGCLLTRPPEITGVNHYEYPTTMDRLMEAVGAQPVDWSYKTDCCGGSLSLSMLSIALDLTRKILRNAKEEGADVIATACPLCEANLDMRQTMINEYYQGDFSIPVLYFTQLLGLAFGAAERELGLDKHFADPRPLLAERRLLNRDGS